MITKQNEEYYVIQCYFYCIVVLFAIFVLTVLVFKYEIKTKHVFLQVYASEKL